MTQALSVNLDELEGLAPEFEGLAEYANNALQEYRQSLTAAGAFWGDDETGDQFASTFHPDSQQAIKNMEQLVSSLRSQSEYIQSVIQELKAQDDSGGAQLTAAGVDAGDSGDGSGGGDAGSSTAQAQPVDFGDDESPASDSGDAGDFGAEQADDPSQAASSADPSQTQSAANSGDQQGEEADQGPAAVDPQSEGDDQAPTGDMTDKRRTRQSAVEPEQTDDSPWGNSVSETESTPWSKNGAAPRGASSSQSPERPGRGSQGSDDEEQDKKQGKKQSAASAGKPEDADAPNPNAALAAALAARHHIEVLGFDTPGVDERTAAEFAAAVDDMLAAYPAIDLRAVAIDALDEGELTRTIWGRTAGATRPVPHTERITLALAVALDPAKFAETIDAAVRSGYLSHGVHTRPVYYAVVREFGHALDIAGGFGARDTAERGLIAEYVSSTDVKLSGMRLAPVVDDYRLWRAQLPDVNFHGPRLDAASALADAFTEVQLRGSEARRPSAVLHRLLVETARVMAGR